MKLYWPRPAHGWRALAGEVAIIVVGVLIALGADQLMESVSWRQKIAALERAMEVELGDYDVPQAYVRDAITPCLVNRLDAIQAVLDQPVVDRARFVTAADDYLPPFRTWDTVAYDATLSSDAISQFDGERLSAWTNAYVLMPRMQTVATEEQSLLSDLRGVRRIAAPIGDSEAERLSRVVDRLRVLNGSSSHNARYVVDGAGLIGVRLAPAVKTRLIREARAKFGACVTVPKPRPPA